MTTIPDAERALHERWLFELTQVPTAAGREDRVERWIEAWAAERPDLRCTRDGAGNMIVEPREPWGRGAGDPVWFTAHLDHPAFVVSHPAPATNTGPDPRRIELTFRGGVMDDYFPGARIEAFTADDRRFEGTIEAKLDDPTPPPAGFKRYSVVLDEAHNGALAVGDVARWLFPRAETIDGCIHTDACDDLAAAAAALGAMDVLRRLHREGEGEEKPGDVRLLFTRAEEIGFVGAIGATKLGTLPQGSKVIALENSRSFDDSPIGGGPIVRVGDRISTFSPALTGAVAQRAEDIAGGSAHVLAIQKQSDAPAWRWQRKLMAGGACEASVFCAAGLESTCVCLPLGNYHNMADLAAVQAGRNTEPPRPGREYVSLSDYRGLVDLLVACGQKLEPAASFRERLDKLYEERRFVLDERAAGAMR